MVLLAWWWWSPMMTEVSSNFWNWFLVNNLRLKFNQDFSVEVWTRFWSWVFAKILGCSSIQILNFGQDLEAEVWSRPWRWSLIEISWLKFGQNSEAEFWPHLIWCDLKGGILGGILYPWVHYAFVHVLNILNEYVSFHSLICFWYLDCCCWLPRQQVWDATPVPQPLRTDFQR